MFRTVDVLGHKVDVLVVDVLEVDQMGWPELSLHKASKPALFLVLFWVTDDFLIYDRLG